MAERCSSSVAFLIRAIIMVVVDYWRYHSANGVARAAFVLASGRYPLNVLFLRDSIGLSGCAVSILSTQRADSVAIRTGHL